MIPPTISAIPDQITDEDTALGAISFTVGRTDLLPDQLTVSAKSSDANLIPDSAIVLDGEGSERALTIYPATNQNGVCTITVTVADRDGANNETSFTLTVNPANDPP